MSKKETPTIGDLLAAEKGIDPTVRGNTAEKYDLLAKTYELDEKIPWLRYAVLYLVFVITIAGCVRIALSYIPHRLDRVSVQTEIIDKLGYFGDAREIKTELDKLADKTGADFCVAALPVEECQEPMDGGGIYIKSIYHDYFTDENHIFIYVTYTGHRYDVNVECGANVARMVRYVPIVKTIQSRITFENTVSTAFVNGLRELNPQFMTLQRDFYVISLGALAAAIFVVLHFYQNVIKRRRFEKAEEES